MTRIGWGAAAALAVATATLTPSAWAAEEKDRVGIYASAVDNMEAAVDRLAREYANPLAIVRRFPEQKRLIDARVFFELGNFESAAIVLLDVLDIPTFKTNLEYEAAELLLGKSLLQLGNVNAAKSHLSSVTRGRDMQLAEEARFYLIEMALDDGSEAALRAIVQQLGGTATSDRTRYGLGKAYLRLDEPDQAILWHQVIGPQSQFYEQARYYLGVAYTSKKDYAQALAVFRQLTGRQAKAPEEQDRRDLSFLAVGRLLVETGKPDEALTTYQNIGRNSPHYEVALYEMAWGYIKQEQYDKALQTVDVLLLTVTDEQINVDAHVLRGRLNVSMDDYEEAMDSYTAIIDRFAPVRNELARFTRDPNDIQRYFDWLLTRQSKTASLSAPLSDKTIKWVESTDAIGRVASVFDRISQETTDIVDARNIGHELERILTSRNRVELFPNLKEGWTRALAIENQLIALSSSILDAQAKLLKKKLSDADRTELDEMLAWRRSLEEKAKELPTTYEGYERRQEAVGNQFQALERKSFIVQQTLAEVKRQLLALETYLNDKQYADEGDKMSAEREALLRAELQDEKMSLETLFVELLALDKTIEAEARAVGTGDFATQGEENLKTSISEAHLREGAFYDRVGLRLGGGVGDTFRRIALLRGRIDQAMGRLDGVIGAIDEQVATKAVELRGLVQRELSSLTGYSGEASTYELEGRDLSRVMGEELFRSAQKRMDQVVLEADVGLLDVVWERKQEKTREIQTVSGERGKRFQQLTDDLDALKHGATDDAPASDASKGGGQ